MLFRLQTSVLSLIAVLINPLYTKSNRGLPPTAWQYTGFMQFEPDTHFVLPNTGDNLGWHYVQATEVEPGVACLSDPKNEVSKLYPPMGTILVLRQSQCDHIGISIFHSENTQMENIKLQLSPTTHLFGIQLINLIITAKRALRWRLAKELLSETIKLKAMFWDTLSKSIK